MRAPCHRVTAWAAYTPAAARRPARPPAWTRMRGRLPGRGRCLCGGSQGRLLLVHPLTEDPKSRLTIELECAHEVGNGAVHVASAASAEPPQEGVIAVGSRGRSSHCPPDT